MEPLRIVVIEDQALLASTLVQALQLEDEIVVVGQSDKANDALELCATQRPDIVLMDIFTKEGNGIEVTARLKREYPGIKVFIMTGVNHEHLVLAAEAAGADMFVWKDLAFNDLVQFIRTAKKSYRIFPGTPRQGAAKTEFSHMDLQILQLLSAGKTTQEIAEALFLSNGTVRHYISRMYGSTGLKSRAQLVSYALKEGLIKPY